METAQTADYALLTLIELEKEDGRTISELSAQLDLNRSVVQRIVATLHRRAMLIRGAKGRYFLGPALISLARGLPHELAGTARPFLRQLAREVEEMAVVSAPEGDEVVVIAHHNGNRSSLRVEYEIGTRHSLARGAGGLSVLSFLDEKTQQRLLPDGAERIASIHRDGYARAAGEIQADLVGFASPIFAGHHGVVGSLAIVAPAVREAKIDERAIQTLKTTAKELGEAYERALDARGVAIGEQLATR